MAKKEKFTMWQSEDAVLAAQTDDGGGQTVIGINKKDIDRSTTAYASADEGEEFQAVMRGNVTNLTLHGKSSFTGKLKAPEEE